MPRPGHVLVAGPSRISSGAAAVTARRNRHRRLALRAGAGRLDRRSVDLGPGVAAGTSFVPGRLGRHRGGRAAWRTTRWPSPHRPAVLPSASPRSSWPRSGRSTAGWPDRCAMAALADTPCRAATSPTSGPTPGRARGRSWPTVERPARRHQRVARQTRMPWWASGRCGEAEKALAVALHDNAIQALIATEWTLDRVIADGDDNPAGRGPRHPRPRRQPATPDVRPRPARSPGWSARSPRASTCGPTTAWPRARCRPAGCGARHDEVLAFRTTRRAKRKRPATPRPAGRHGSGRPDLRRSGHPRAPGGAVHDDGRGADPRCSTPGWDGCPRVLSSRARPCSRRRPLLDRADPAGARPWSSTCPGSSGVRRLRPTAPRAAMRRTGRRRSGQQVLLVGLDHRPPAVGHTWLGQDATRVFTVSGDTCRRAPMSTLDSPSAISASTSSSLGDSP